MSARFTCKTSFNSRTMLVDSLGELYGPEAISVSADRIMVKIPGLYGGASFRLAADGNYELVYDSTDCTKLKNILPQKKGDKIVNKLAQIYSRMKVTQDATAAVRGTLIGNTVEPDGKMRLRIRVVTYGEE